MARCELLLAVSDLLFQSKIEGTAHGLGFNVRVIAAEPPYEDLSATVVVVDLNEPAIEPARLIAAAKAAGATVLAFGRHTEPTALRAARAAGADRVVPRSQLVEELPDLLRELAPAVAGPGSG